ncbi:MAG: sigma-70 family RNA polymerase sigma factor [Nitrospirae bacterium]|nr:sigma-70 family RNA polymerase sigma factor [Nitrospirota bacterium]
MAFDQAFQDIYLAFNEKIRRYLARIVNETEADDLAQDVFIKVGRGLKFFKGKSTLSTWIYKIATNAALDRLRALSLQKGAAVVQRGDDDEEAEDRYLRVEDHKPSLETSLIKKEMNDCIRGIADGLPENYRTVLVLSDFEELSSGEIAAILGISADTVKIRLHRARTRLRKELKAKCNLYRDDRNELACERISTPLRFKEK